MSLFAFELNRYGDEVTCSTAEESGIHFLHRQQNGFSSTRFRSPLVPIGSIKRVAGARSLRGKGE
jgi:hypothetical protein